MPMNDMSFEQVSTVLNAINQQATGATSIAATDTASFIAQAQAVLKTGYDPVCAAISQVLSRTIFSIRPYSSKFRGLMVSAQRYGNHVRKINWGDKPLVDDDRIQIVDGVPVPQQIPNVPNVLQTNFYGESVFQHSYTLFKDQLDVAFSGPDEFQRFIAGTVQNANDVLEQSRENLARMLLANYIGAKVTAVSASLETADSVVHLLTEYNTQSGQTLTATTVYQPANFVPFMRWVYSRIAAISARMTERSYIYHTNVTAWGTSPGVDKSITRHTPVNMQRVYLYAPARFQIEAQVLSDTFHDNYLRFADNETVNFWQSIETPDQVTVRPSWLAADGTVATLAGTDPDVEVAPIFGLIIDEETLGWTPVNQWQTPAPFNARAGFTTVWMHETQRHWTDMTENGCILLLD